MGPKPSSKGAGPVPERTPAEIAQIRRMLAEATPALADASRALPTVPAVTDGERVVGICTVCQVPLSTGNAHDAGFGSCGEEMFTCLDHCAECTPPHARHVRTT